MKLILDTHILLWWWDNSARLPDRARELIADTDNDVLVSAVSITEIAVKRSIGRLTITDDFAAGIESDGFTELPLTARHGGQVAALPLLHRDPSTECSSPRPRSNRRRWSASTTRCGSTT